MVTVAEALSSFERVAERRARFKAMVDYVIERLVVLAESPESPEGRAWAPYALELTEAGRRLSPHVEEDWDEMEALVEQGYRRMKLELDPAMLGLRLPRTKEDLEQLREITDADIEALRR